MTGENAAHGGALFARLLRRRIPLRLKEFVLKTERAEREKKFVENKRIDLGRVMKRCATSGRRLVHDGVRASLKRGGHHQRRGNTSQSDDTDLGMPLPARDAKCVDQIDAGLSVAIPVDSIEKDVRNDEQELIRLAS